MADFIEWQQFEELYLNIKDNDFFNTISLSRDENFNTKRNPQALPVVRQCVLHGQ